jgi:DNA-binding response OmpR family regulator
MAATVLVVDDEPRILELYAKWLEGSYEVRTAENGEAALDVIDDAVDIVLLDRRMPDMTGDMVLDRIREWGYDPWVVMVTAVNPDTDVVDLGFDDYLLKPVQRDELVDVVESMLARDEHDETLRTYFETLAKLGMLEANYTQQELADNESYRALQRRHEEARESLSDTVSAARDAGDFEQLFVEFPGSLIEDEEE